MAFVRAHRSNICDSSCVTKIALSENPNFESPIRIAIPLDPNFNWSPTIYIYPEKNSGLLFGLFKPAVVSLFQRSKQKTDKREDLEKERV